MFANELKGHHVQLLKHECINGSRFITYKLTLNHYGIGRIIIPAYLFYDYTVMVHNTCKTPLFITLEFSPDGLLFETNSPPVHVKPPQQLGVLIPPIYSKYSGLYVKGPQNLDVLVYVQGYTEHTN